ncbi:MAG TPA: TolC family protein [Bryobacteraceae bacterium]|nr:TolC family protein [Bryobacteraceae bacterium]
MRRFKAPVCCLCSFLLAVSSVLGQSAAAQSAVRIEPVQGGFSRITAPYRQRYIPPVNLNNTDRLESLIRDGNLYLSAQDVIALALENNLDIEIQRYQPLLSKELTRRAEGGGLLRSVGVGIAQGPTSVSLTGVSLNSGGTSNGASNLSTTAVLTAVGPSPQSLDPNFFAVTQFQHSTTPLSNLVLTGTAALVVDSRFYNAGISKNTDYGAFYQVQYTSTYQKYNSQSYTLNPFTSANIDFQFSQNLLQGFGRPVLGRYIRVAKNNEKISDLQFKQQVITTVSAVLNLYWDLVSFNEDLKARKDELATAQQLFEDNKKQVQIGTLAPIEVTRAEAQVYSSQQDLLISQTNLLQQETVLKNALSRKGVENPVLAGVRIVPIDTVQVPPKEELKPLDELVDAALKKRLEIAQDQLNLDSTSINLRAVKSGLKPSLQVFAELTNNGLSGSQNYLTPGAPAELPYLTGGYGNLLGQIARRNFPNYSAGLSLSIPLRNRQAQSDYVTTALGLRQSELAMQKDRNQVRVDVQNAVISVRQARVRYESSVKARILQQQTLDADKKKYTLGAGTVFQVVTDQQTLSAAISTEQQALANYSHARISFDQAMGTTLDVNQISIDEALLGTVSRKSGLPTNLPAAVQAQPQPEQKQ